MLNTLCARETLRCGVLNTPCGAKGCVFRPHVRKGLRRRARATSRCTRPRGRFCETLRISVRCANCCVEVCCVHSARAKRCVVVCCIHSACAKRCVSMCAARSRQPRVAFQCVRYTPLCGCETLGFRDAHPSTFGTSPPANLRAISLKPLTPKPSGGILYQALPGNGRRAVQSGGYRVPRKVR